MVIGVKLKPNIRASNWFERNFLFYGENFLFCFFQNQNNKKKNFKIKITKKFCCFFSSSLSFRLEHSKRSL